MEKLTLSRQFYVQILSTGTVAYRYEIWFAYDLDLGKDFKDKKESLVNSTVTLVSFKASFETLKCNIRKTLQYCAIKFEEQVKKMSLTSKHTLVGPAFVHN